MLNRCHARSARRPEGRRCGFTLIELLLVMGLVAVLAALLVGGSRLAVRKSREGRARAAIEELREAVEAHQLDRGHLPSELSDARLGPWLDDDFEFEDPWGRDYRFVRIGAEGYRLWSDGVQTNTAADDLE